MKNLFAIALLLGPVLSAFAQGTIRFSNDTSDLSTPPDRLVRFDATASWINPAYVTGAPVFSNSSPGLRAQLYYGASTEHESSLVAVTTAPSTFKNSTSANVGTWFAGVRSLTGFSNGTLNLQVRVWDINLASSFEAATALGDAYAGLIGKSLIFTYTIPTEPLSGGPGAFRMGNFESFMVGLPIPEPSVAALALIGCGIIVVSKWRNRAAAKENKR